MHLIDLDPFLAEGYEMGSLTSFRASFAASALAQIDNHSPFLQFQIIRSKSSGSGKELRQIRESQQTDSNASCTNPDKLDETTPLFIH
jgi:hypothetical protein